MTGEKAVVTQATLTREQIDLVRHTVAVGATDNELQLFLYQAKKRGLDPLTRQIHFIKRKRYNPDTEKYDEVGTIQTGIDGFRVIADRTEKLAGISRGVIRNEKGDLVGAWAEIFRSDWTHPAREEVSFNEYCQRKKDGSPMGLWASMPETMIKKVAEAAALRMAFPEDLSGIYTHDEMQQADTEIKPIDLDRKLIAKPKVSPIDLKWLKEQLTTLQGRGLKAWSNTNVVSYLKTITDKDAKSITEAVGNLTEEQAVNFAEEVKKAIELS